jgi:regulation of enolase protein 1 (concanavalin A-like superfamily)
MHAAGLIAPIEVEYFPVVHGMQEEEDWAPFRGVYFPARQYVHVVIISWSPYDPGGHERQAPIEVEYFPVVHGRHEEEDWAPFKSEYFPAGQFVHVVIISWSPYEPG